MTMDETTMEEIIRRAGTATSFSRMNNTEAKAHINWLLSNGFKCEGAALQREQSRGKPQAYRADGQPIWKQ
jgi:hypothetical protein